MKIITPTFAIPGIHHMALMLKSDEVYVEHHEHYQKRSCRNRFSIIDHQGLKSISIPLKKGKHEQMPISEVEISYDSDWQYQVIKTIRTAYGKSAYFEFYYPGFEKVWNQKADLLIEFNASIFAWLKKSLKTKINLQSTLSFELNYDLEYLDLRGKIPQWQQDYYPQVFEDRLGFVQGASILDLVFCLGPEASPYLRKIAESFPENTQI